jgi:hypothetical protein
VQAQDTGEDVSEAEVTIEVSGKAPLDAITDSKGMARIFVDSSYAGCPGFLTVEAKGYERYTQNIDVVEGALPDVVRLKPTASSVVLMPLNKPTVTPTEEPTPELQLTKESTPEPTEESTTEPTAEPTVEPTKKPTSKPANIPTPTSPAATVTGRLAIPLVMGITPKVYVVSTEGELLGVLDMARQPDYRKDGMMLIVNGDGGPSDKLRVSDSIGDDQKEIGDPGLAGHSHPAWSPDSKQVIYDDNTLGCGGWCIFRRDLGSASGEGEILDTATGPILGANSLHPLWTTQDRFIFRGCNSWSGGGDCGIWMMQGNRGELQKLTDNFNHIPTDVHDNVMVYVSQEASDWNVYSLNIVTGATRQLTFDPAADGLATISPDGLSVAFLSNRQGRLAVWWVGINGGNPQKMFDIPAEWGTLQSDGWSEEKLSWGG